jgi:hypothetical protein
VFVSPSARSSRISACRADNPAAWSLVARDLPRGTLTPRSMSALLTLPAVAVAPRSSKQRSRQSPNSPSTAGTRRTSPDHRPRPIESRIGLPYRGRVAQSRPLKPHRERRRTCLPCWRVPLPRPNDPPPAQSDGGSPP